MKRNSIKTRIILTSAVVLALALAINATLDGLFFEREYIRSMESRLLMAGDTLGGRLNHLLILGFTPEEIVGFEEECREIVLRHHLAYATIVDREGRILFHNDPAPPLSFSRHPLLPRMAAATRTGIRLLEIEGKKYYNAFTPIRSPEGEHLGAVMVGFPEKAVRERTARFILPSITVAFFSFLLALGLLSFILTLSVTRPLGDLVRGIDRFREGGERSPLAPRGPAADEIERLGKAFHRLLDDLYASREELERHARELQEMVDERTKELKETNEALAKDIARRELAEEELARRAAELSRSNADLEHFAYIASHDLKEPLRMIASYLQLLARRYRGRLDAQADEFIGYAVDGARRMEAMINGLLAYARVGTTGKPFAPTDANSALDQALANLQVAMAESGAAVERGELPVVHADCVQLVQVFQNLIGNAIKFRREEPPRIRVEAARTDRAWRFTVRDNGLGFDPKYAEKIFLAFQRLHPQGEFPGAGIGLAICQRIVERHGGRIWAESVPGQGTSFHFTIPDQGGSSAHHDRIRNERPPS